jgi:hypothetical protein
MFGEGAGIKIGKKIIQCLDTRPPIEMVRKIWVGVADE